MKNDQPRDKIELLSVDLLGQNRKQVLALKRLAHSLSLELGWHYLLDLTWILSQLGPIKGKRVMDAGAGVGVMQWYLAQEGAEVLSVDRLSRASLPLRFRARFRVRGLRSDVQTDLISTRQMFKNNITGRDRLSVKMTHQARELVGMAHLRRGTGRVVIYNQDLLNLADIPAESLDAVVAVSALEHNSPENLGRVVLELMRVIKPGGKLLATLCAAPDQDRWHAPSSGWCYTDASLRRLFCLPPDTPSNYERYDELFSALYHCAELRDGLAKFYFQSDKNGMPWGKWDPQYITVGICKIKSK